MERFGCERMVLESKKIEATRWVWVCLLHFAVAATLSLAEYVIDLQLQFDDFIAYYRHETLRVCSNMSCSIHMALEFIVLELQTRGNAT